MSTRVADDVKAVAERMRQLAQERELASDVDKASGKWLDLHGRRVGVERLTGEGDYEYRLRVKRAL